MVLTRERRFNESLFNGASCLFIIKSGAVFAVPRLAPRPPSRAHALPLKTIVSRIISANLNGTVYFVMHLENDNSTGRISESFVVK